MAPTKTSKLQRESKRTSPKPFTPKRVICPDCGSSVNRKTDLPRHRKRHEPNPVRYYCQYSGCDFSCLQKSALKPHGNKHSGNRTEHCPDCPASFADRSSLSRHRKAEHGYQPYHTKAYLEAKANQPGVSKKSVKKNASKTGAVRAENRDERRAAPYGVPAQAARSAARAKRAAKESSNAFADAGLFYAPSNDVHESSPFSDFSELLSSLPPLSPSSDSRSFTTSSVPGTPKELSPPPFWNDFAANIMEPSMPQCPPFLDSVPMCGYEIIPTDGDWATLIQQDTMCYGTIKSAPTPAQNWTGANVNSHMFHSPVPVAPALAPESNMFQSTPVSYNGDALQSMYYPVPEPVFRGAYDQWQYALPPVEQQPAAPLALSELAVGMGVSEQEMMFWLDEIVQSTPAFGPL